MKKKFKLSAEEALRDVLRQAVADYIGSEGCSCCRGSDHDEHQATLARLLHVEAYPDGAGYNFPKYKSKP